MARILFNKLKTMFKTIASILVILCNIILCGIAFVLKLLMLPGHIMTIVLKRIYDVIEDSVKFFLILGLIVTVAYIISDCDTILCLIPAYFIFWFVVSLQGIFQMVIGGVIFVFSPSEWLYQICCSFIASTKETLHNSKKSHSSYNAYENCWKSEQREYAYWRQQREEQQRQQQREEQQRRQQQKEEQRRQQQKDNGSSSTGNDSYKKALEILCMQAPFTQKELKASRNRMIKEYHPDEGKCSNSNVASEINVAYDLLLKYASDAA